MLNVHSFIAHMSSKTTTMYRILQKCGETLDIYKKKVTNITY